jgi:hypothetical protein
MNRSFYMIFNENPTLLKAQTFLSKLIETPQFVYFNALLPYPLKGSLFEVFSTSQL